jgi:hypothetical protein
MSDKHPPDTANPKGALTITLFYLAMVIAAWCYMYFILLGRGVNQ